MNKFFIFFILISYCAASCNIKEEEFNIVLKSKRNDKINIVIKEKDIISIDWEHQSYLLSDEIKKTLKDSINSIAFASSFLDFNINSEKIYTVGIGCTCSHNSEHLGSNFAYIFLGCDNYFKPIFFEKNGYYQISYNGYGGMKNYLFNDRLYQLLLKKGKIVSIVH